MDEIEKPSCEFLLFIRLKHSLIYTLSGDDYGDWTDIVNASSSSFPDQSRTCEAIFLVKAVKTREQKQKGEKMGTNIHRVTKKWVELQLCGNRVLKPLTPSSVCAHSDPQRCCNTAITVGYVNAGLERTPDAATNEVNTGTLSLRAGAHTKSSAEQFNPVEPLSKENTDSIISIH